MTLRVTLEERHFCINDSNISQTKGQFWKRKKSLPRKSCWGCVRHGQFKVYSCLEWWHPSGNWPHDPKLFATLEGFWELLCLHVVPRAPTCELHSSEQEHFELCCSICPLLLWLSCFLLWDVHHRVTASGPAFKMLPHQQNVRKFYARVEKRGILVWASWLL